MSNRLFKLNTAGFAFVSITGTLCHFVYEWSGYSKIAALLCPVNESSWEHLKLIFFPYLVWTIIQYFIMKKDKGIIFGKATGVLFGMLCILVIYYTYTGIIGKNINFIDVLSFFVGVLTAFVVDYNMIKSGKFKGKFYDIIGVAAFAAIAILFFLFTYAPPLIPLFRDPMLLSYGI